MSSSIPSISANLIRLRHQSQLTQQQLADLSCVSRATVHLIESGRSDPRVSTLELLAKALKVPVSELIAPPVVRAAVRDRDRA